MKRYVKLSIFAEKAPKEGLSLEGRLLGLISEGQFEELLETSSKLRNKIYTVATTPLKKVNNFGEEEVKGKRMVVALRKCAGGTVVGKDVFISGPIQLIGHFSENGYKDDGADMGISTENDTYIELKEVEKC
jgi:hypothetical protein